MASVEKRIHRVCMRFAPLIIVSVLYVVLLCLTFNCSPDWTARQTWAVIFTGAVVIWYTWETMRLRQVALAQIDMQIRPFVVVEYENGQFRIRNLGPGTALNVKVRDITINVEENIRVVFPVNIPILAAGEVRTISVTSYHGNQPAGDFFTFHVKPDLANGDLEITVDFQNITMKRMFVVEEVRQQDLRIVRASSDVGL